MRRTAASRRFVVERFRPALRENLPWSRRTPFGSRPLENQLEIVKDITLVCKGLCCAHRLDEGLEGAHDGIPRLLWMFETCPDFNPDWNTAPFLSRWGLDSHKSWLVLSNSSCHADNFHQLGLLPELVRLLRVMADWSEQVREEESLMKLGLSTFPIC